MPRRGDSKNRKRKILIADESITIQKLVNLTFADRSVEVITASDGPDALTKVKRLQPDIVLADTQLRQVDGIEICEAIRSDASLSAVRVILLKGKVSKDFEERIASVKVDEILEKPFDSKALAAAVDRCLEDEESTVVKPAGPFSTHSTSKKKIDAPALEIESDDESESETITKKVDLDEESVTKKLTEDESVQPKDEEQSVTIKTEKFRPARGDFELQEPLVVKTQAAPAVPGISLYPPPPAPSVDPDTVSKIAETQIREWLEKNIPAMAEKILKEEIARLTQVA